MGKNNIKTNWTKIILWIIFLFIIIVSGIFIIKILNEAGKIASPVGDLIRGSAKLEYLLAQACSKQADCEKITDKDNCEKLDTNGCGWNDKNGGCVNIFKRDVGTMNSPFVCYSWLFALLTLGLSFLLLQLVKLISSLRKPSKEVDAIATATNKDPKVVEKELIETVNELEAKIEDLEKNKDEKDQLNKEQKEIAVKTALNEKINELLDKLENRNSAEATQAKKMFDDLKESSKQEYKDNAEDENKAEAEAEADKAETIGEEIVEGGV